MCPVDLEFSPFHPERPGLSILYHNKSRWRQVAEIGDLYAVVINPDGKVEFELRTQNDSLKVLIDSTEARDSFVSGLCGYYRCVFLVVVILLLNISNCVAVCCTHLPSSTTTTNSLMHKWATNLCVDFASPQLERLTRLKCHGPIGGPYAYQKLQDQQNRPGSYLVRQCERTYGTYYVDIICTGKQPETYRVTNEYNNMWHLHGHDDGAKPSTFNDLVELVTSIRTEAKQKTRLAAGENGKRFVRLKVGGWLLHAVCPADITN